MQFKNHCSMKRMVLMAVCLIFAATMTFVAVSPPAPTDMENTKAEALAITTPAPVLTGQSFAIANDMGVFSANLTPSSSTSPPNVNGNVAIVVSDNSIIKPLAVHKALASINTDTGAVMGVTNNVLKVPTHTANTGVISKGYLAGGMGRSAPVVVINDNQKANL